MNFEDTFIGRPNTKQTYKSLLNKHIKTLIKETHCKSFNKDHMITCLRQWEINGLSVSTRQTLLRLTKNYVKFYGGPDIKIKHLLQNLERSEQQKEITVLSKTEAELLMRTCHRLEPKFYPILLLALHAGLRRGEIFGLLCGDIDLFKNKIRVAHSYTGPTKNGKTRYVPMSDELSKEMLKARNLLMRPVNTKIFEIMNPNPILRRLCAHAGLQMIRFHDLRHTFASLALEKGISPKQVANWLGHSNVNTTLSLYWHLNKDETDINSFLPGG